MSVTSRVFAASLSMLIAAACTATSPSATGAPPSPATQGTLKIGVLVPYTEAALDADIGASQKRAADLYLKLQNGRLGGRDVQLVWNDESLLDPKINDVRIKQFLDQDHVELLMGGAGSAAARQLRDTADASRLVYIDTNATSNALTRATSGCAPTCKSKYVFRASSTSWQLSEPLGEWASRNGRRDFYLAYADDTFGTESAAAFTEGLAKNGGMATGRTAVPEKSGDWAKIVGTIKTQPTKSVFAAFSTDDAEGFIAAWDAAGMRSGGYTLVGPGPLADSEVLKVTKQAAVGVITAFDWSAELATSENRAFVDAFRAAYKDEGTGAPLVPDGYALEMWNAMRALDEALKQTKGDTKNVDGLVAALENVSFAAPNGSFAFDKTTHNPTVDVYIREVRASGGSLVNAVIDKIGGVRDPG